MVLYFEVQTKEPIHVNIYHVCNVDVSAVWLSKFCAIVISFHIQILRHTHILVI